MSIPIGPLPKHAHQAKAALYESRNRSTSETWAVAPMAQEAPRNARDLLRLRVRNGGLQLLPIPS
eukprot:1350600-Alexandrium_andersonii.AAC.1